ncbi:MAG TPA: hypothetical protein VGT99_09090 [Gammaproteobacteria bacterium]|nr:hypothetical protein [Gammaproteobacteria bacterium]
MGKSAAPISTLRLHTLAALLDLAGLALLLLQGLFLVPAAGADRRTLLLTAAVVPLALVVFAVMPRRAQFLAETEVPRRSLMAYASLGVPVLVTLLTLVLVAVNHSFDAFAGFALLLAADAGRNLWECLSLRLKPRR